jgi:hypothetical protein
MTFANRLKVAENLPISSREGFQRKPSRLHPLQLPAEEGYYPSSSRSASGI